MRRERAVAGPRRVDRREPPRPQLSLDSGVAGVGIYGESYLPDCLLYRPKGTVTETLAGRTITPNSGSIGNTWGSGDGHDGFLALAAGHYSLSAGTNWAASVCCEPDAGPSLQTVGGWWAQAPNVLAIQGFATDSGAIVGSGSGNDGCGGSMSYAYSFMPQ
jgi:hypothetical protein